MIQNGSVVKLNYTGKFPENGEVFDSSIGNQPLEFTVGQGQLIKGFENGVIGLNVGDKKIINIGVDEAYGQSRSDLIIEVPKSNCPEGVQNGNQLQTVLQDGRVANFVVVDVKDETVVLDANHPLCGRDLQFEVEILEVN